MMWKRNATEASVILARFLNVSNGGYYNVYMPEVWKHESVQVAH